MHVFEPPVNPLPIDSFSLCFQIGCVFGPLCCIPLFFMKDPNPNTTFDGEGQLSSIQKPFLTTPHKTPLLGPTSPMLKRDRIGSHCSDFSGADCNSPSALPERTWCEGFDTFSATPNSVNSEDERFKRMTKWERMIPFVLTTADFITDVGAGMTVRFFPLFFINDYQVSPIGLCGIFCLYPLCVAM